MGYSKIPADPAGVSVYGQALTIALASGSSGRDRSCARRVMASVTPRWNGGRGRQNWQSIVDPGFGDLIRLALTHRIEGS